MKWTKLTIETTTEATDMISYMLNELGVEGIEIEDHVPLTKEDMEKMFVDLLPDEIAPDDGTAKINCYLEENKTDEDIIILVNQINIGLDDIANFLNVGTRKITIGETEDKDWINNWKQYFKAFRLDDNIIIKPTWENLENINENDIVIEIDPGIAFGTGSHETTKLCISQLKKYIKPDTKLLDVGCGSGILSIIGLKLGAKQAVGTDIDENAIVATKENCEVNGISSDKITAIKGNIISDKDIKDKVGYQEYDIIMANILADVLIPLSKEIVPHLKKGGYFVTSGILNTKEQEVKNAFIENGLKIVETTHMEDWVSVTATI